MGIFDIIGFHIHVDGGKLVINLGSKKSQILLLRIGMALLGIPIMMYTLPPEKSFLLFVIGLGFWILIWLFGNLKTSKS